LEKPRIKAIYGTGKYRVDHIINQSNEVIKDFEVNVQKKKEIRFDINIFAETEIDNEPCLLIVALDITERKKATEDLKKNKTLTTSNATLRKSELSLVKSNDTFF
jgi:precorrin isomerase